MALVFERPSTRTRLSFEAGVVELGGHPLILRGDELQLSRGESLRDLALVLSRQVHAVGVRTGAHATVEELARHGSIPVVNMLTADHHPCQALADLFTLRERFGELRGSEAGLRGRRQQRRALAGRAGRAGRRGGHGVPRPTATGSSRRRRAAGRRPGGGGGRRQRRVRRRVGVDGRRGHRRRAPRRAGALPPGRRAARPRRRPTRSPCTACPRTPARRSAPRCCTASAS